VALVAIVSTTLHPGEASAQGAGGAGGADGGVCDSGLTTGDEGIDGCLSALCCTELEACTGSETCRACLLGEGMMCNANQRYTEWLACSDARCANDICGTGVSFLSGTGTPEYECNACATQCCTCIQSCVGGGTDEEINLCLDCLGDPVSCPDPAVASAARNFYACSDQSCTSECGISGVMGGDAVQCTPPPSGDGGGGGTGGAGGGSDAAPELQGDTSDCSCTAPGGDGRAAPAWLLLALPLLGKRRRR
jgi:hypothetical protein